MLPRKPSPRNRRALAPLFQVSAASSPHLRRGPGAGGAA